MAHFPNVKGQEPQRVVSGSSRLGCDYEASVSAWKRVVILQEKTPSEHDPFSPCSCPMKEVQLLPGHFAASSLHDLTR